MNEMYFVSFNSTHHAIKSEKIFLENKINCTTLPTPREVSASCGISIRFLKEDLDKVIKVLDESEFRGIFRLVKDEDGKKIVFAIK